LQFDPTTLEIHWQYTPLEAGFNPVGDASKFYSPYISSAQRLPNGNTLITEGSDGRLLEVTEEHELVWEYINPYSSTLPGGSTLNMVYRAYRVPYDWVPQAAKPEEIAVDRIDSTVLRVPGASKGLGTGKITSVAGLDANNKIITGMAPLEDSEEGKADFCLIRPSADS
jgi:hypothetical protein